MKTLAALGLLLFSGVLVVSGAMMGTLEAGQDVGDPASRTPGLREIRVYLRGPDGRALPRDRVSEASILVQPVTRPRPEEAPAAAPGGTLSRRLALQWVEPRGDRREGIETRPGGQERRDGEGVEARVVVLEPEESPDDEGGGYWRAAYAPPADHGVEGFETTVIFKDRGLTRTIAGFVHPPADRDGGSGDPAVK